MIVDYVYLFADEINAQRNIKEYFMKAIGNKNYVLNLRKKNVLLLLALSYVGFVQAEHLDADQVIVTSVHTTEPLVIQTDPRIPRQPLPSHDGADYLKTIPGFSVMRKGGSDGEPVLRGMAGSRLNVLVDGQNVLGGCSMRMDAPTSYIFPEAYDKLKVVKGPQTVLYGPGASAGSVMFERSISFLKEPGYKGRASLLVGSFGRNDEVADVKAGNEQFYIQGVATNSRSGDYKDGNGNDVHSSYKRYSGNLALGLAIDENTKLELSAAYSDGWASYADRAMDGTKFQRENFALRFEKSKISNVINKISFQISQNDIDHVMDDYKLRTPGTMGWARLKHKTNNVKLSSDLILSKNTDLTVGLDFQSSQHEKGFGKNLMAAMMGMPSSSPMTDDSKFQQIGLFGEVRHQIYEDTRVIAGYRADFWDAKDKRSLSASDTGGKSRSDTLSSAFGRFEKDLTIPVTLYAGLGHAERFPDYWELIPNHRSGTVDSNSAFLVTKNEKTNQLDIGFLSHYEKLNLSSSLFYNKINDFILIDNRSGYVAAMSMYSSTRNVDAHTYGGELDLTYKIDDAWKTNASVAYVKGRNETDGLDLAQLPPLEGRLGLNYDNKTWFAGGLFRLVSEQNNYSIGQGNIAGKDIGRSSGFGIFSMHAGWRPSANSVVTAGVDNLFDKTYAEFISRSGSNGMGGAIAGYNQTTRVNEPGRTFWLKGTINF